MGFIRNLFSGREINRLEELIKTSPAPSLFLRLAQLYRQNGQEEDAAQIIRRGATLFPESEALTEAQADAERVQHDAERRRLRAKIEQFPSPMVYARLAKLHLKDGELSEAEKICKEGCRDFPDYGGLWALQGQVALEQGDLVQGVERLEKAAALDKYNYNALLLLAEGYIKQGRRPEGRRTLESVLEFAPADDHATRFLNEFDARADALEQETQAQPAAEAQRPSATQEEAAPAEPLAEAKRSSGVGTGLHEEIKQIRRVDGVRATILIDPSGLVIASDLPERMGEDLSAALISSIARSVKGHSAELGLGVFEDGIVHTPDGCIHVLTLDQMTMGVFAATHTKSGLLQRAIHTFAERVIETYH